MRSALAVLVAAMVLGFSGVAAAGGDKGNVMGEVTKIEGEMVTVKMADGTTKSIHVDPKGTKKEGDLKVGSHVSAKVESSGHATWIKAGDGMMK